MGASTLAAMDDLVAGGRFGRQPGWCRVLSGADRGGEWAAAGGRRAGAGGGGGGQAGRDRSNGLEGTSTFAIHPTLGAEQAIVPEQLWLRAGLDETTWTGGGSVAVGLFKLDLAYLRNLAAARTNDVFGKQNTSFIGTIVLDYEKLVARPEGPLFLTAGC
jgi:hypothetical protein